MANNVGCNASGGSCQYDHDALVAGGVYPSVPSGPIAGKTRILVGVSPAFKIYDWFGGDSGGTWELRYSYNMADSETITDGGGDSGEEGGPEDGGGGIPDFKPTGPVYTPLDPAGIAQRDYSAYYPQSYMPTDPAYPTMGLLSTPAFGGTDLYQPWSAQYGSNVAPSSLWDYTPPSPLDVSAGPKVTFE